MLGLTGLTLGISKGGLSGWDDPVVIVSIAVGVVLLPDLRARRAPRPRADARHDDLRGPPVLGRRAGAFLNGLARFALMFLFVFYFQGAQGDGPVLAGVKLAPLALGMLVASPTAGIYADRHGSRVLAAVGMGVTALGLALMTTLRPASAYWRARSS